MKKYKSIIIIILTLFFIGSIFLVFIFNSGKSVVEKDEGVSGSNPIFGIFGGNNGGEGESSGNLGGGGERPLLKLRKISDGPVAGFIVFEKDGHEGSFVRYTDRATGHVYESRTDSLEIKRISNTTIPRIYEAVWSGKNQVTYRYLDEKDNIKTFSSTIIEGDEGKEGEIEGSFLSGGIVNFINYGGKVLKQNNYSDYSSFSISDFGGKNEREIFKSPLKEWNLQGTKSNLIAMTTKPSFGIQGFLFFLNVDSGNFSKVMGPVEGLTTLVSPDLNKVLLSSNIELKYFDIESKKIKPFGEKLSTLSDKCVWSKDSSSAYCGIPSHIQKGKYPDDWYKGAVSFSDDIYKVGLTDKAEFLISPEAFSGEQIDLIKPQLNAGEDFLFFINKKDLFLWSLDLSDYKNTEKSEGVLEE